MKKFVRSFIAAVESRQIYFRLDEKILVFSFVGSLSQRWPRCRFVSSLVDIFIGLLVKSIDMFTKYLLFYLIVQIVLPK